MSSLTQFREIVSLLFRVVDFKADMEDVDSLLLKITNLLEEDENCVSQEEKALKKHITNVFLAGDLLNPPTPPTLRIHPDAQEEDILVPNVVVTKTEPETKQVSVQPPALVGNLIVNLPLVKTESVKTESVKPESVKPESVKPEPSSVEETNANAEEEDVEIMKSLREEEGEAHCEVVEDDDAAADEDAAADDDAADEDAADEDAADEDAADEDIEEEEAMEVVKIKKRKYFVGERTRRAYEYIDDETAGEECLGTYDEQTNKIIPL